MQTCISSIHNRSIQLMNDMCIVELSYQCRRIPNTLNATNTYKTARHVHNPVYGDTRPTGPSQTNQQRLARDGKKIEHAYEVIPPASTSNQHNSKQRGNTTGQAKIHNTGKLCQHFSTYTKTIVLSMVLMSKQVEGNQQ